MEGSDAPALHSLLLGSADPDRLLRWYAEALATSPSRDGCLDLGGVSLRIGHRAELSGRNPEPGRMVLTLSVDDIAVAERRLIAMRVAWVREVERANCGLIGTVLDRDGNYVQVMQKTGVQR